MRPIPFLVPWVGALLLAACATRQVEETGPTVTYDYSGTSFEEAAERAEEYCLSEYGRSAVLLDAEGGGDEVATFACE